MVGSSYTATAEHRTGHFIDTENTGTVGQYIACCFLREEKNSLGYIELTLASNHWQERITLRERETSLAPVS